MTNRSQLIDHQPEMTRLVAGKAFTLLGVSYKPGDSVDTSKISNFKISQLMSQRFLVPAKT